MRAIRGRLPLPTPGPSYENLDTRAVGTALIGYLRLPGEPLWRDTLFTQDEKVRHALAAQLARFLQALHSVPADVLPSNLRVQDGHEQWADVYRRIRDKLFPLKHPASRALLTWHLESYLDQTENASHQPVLRHGDFGPSNILFDAASSTISGVIDFGSAGFGDPALDVAGVMGPFGYGETFVRLSPRSMPRRTLSWIVPGSMRAPSRFKRRCEDSSTGIRRHSTLESPPTAQGDR